MRVQSKTPPRPSTSLAIGMRSPKTPPWPSSSLAIGMRIVTQDSPLAELEFAPCARDEGNNRRADSEPRNRRATPRIHSPREFEFASTHYPPTSHMASKGPLNLPRIRRPLTALLASTLLIVSTGLEGLLRASQLRRPVHGPLLLTRYFVTRPRRPFSTSPKFYGPRDPHRPPLTRPRRPLVIFSTSSPTSYCAVASLLRRRPRASLLIHSRRRRLLALSSPRLHYADPLRPRHLAPASPTIPISSSQQHTDPGAPKFQHRTYDQIRPPRHPKIPEGTRRENKNPACEDCNAWTGFFRYQLPDRRTSGKKCTPLYETLFTGYELRIYTFYSHDRMPVRQFRAPIHDQRFFSAAEGT